MSSGLNVLSLTAGESLLEKRSDGSFNQQQLRQIEYAGHLGRYFIITRTLRPKTLEPMDLAPNLTVYPSNSRSRLAFLSDAMKIASKICNRERIDVVSPRDPFLFGRLGTKIKRKYNIPLAVHVMGDMIDNPYFFKERFGNRILNWRSKSILAGADAIRVSTSNEKEKIIRLGFPEEKIFRVPFFVDFGPFLGTDGEDKRAELLGDRHKHIVLTVSRFSKEKNVPMVVSAAAKVIRENDRVLFIIVGGGKMENEIRRLVDSMRLEENVLFAGYIDNSILPEYYHASDAFAISSFYEGTCMVLLEAAGSSLPIVSTATAGAADAIIEGETGYTVPVGDDTMFARRLLELLDNPSKAKEMGRRGRVYVLEKFDKEKIVKDYVSMWEYAASKKRK